MHVCSSVFPCWDMNELMQEEYKGVYPHLPLLFISQDFFLDMPMNMSKTYISFQPTHSFLFTFLVFELLLSRYDMCMMIFS